MSSLRIVFHVFNYSWCPCYLWIAMISSEFIISYMKLEFFLLKHHLTFNCSKECRQARGSRKKQHEWKSVGCCLLGAVCACVITVTVINFISQVQTRGGCFKNSSYAESPHRVLSGSSHLLHSFTVGPLLEWLSKSLPFLQLPLSKVLSLFTLSLEWFFYQQINMLIFPLFPTPSRGLFKGLYKDTVCGGQTFSNDCLSKLLNPVIGHSLACCVTEASGIFSLENINSH